MASSKLDTVYRSLLMSRFFTKGFGKPEHLKRLFELRRQMARRSVAYSHVDPQHPVTITHQETKSDHKILEGYFLTPFAQLAPELVPNESVKAHFQVVLPLEWKTDNYRPMCIHYAGTGDHFFWRRRHMMALPMLRERGIGSIILENPFYGLRKPKDQVRSSLQQVSDLFVMGGCLMTESLVLFNWCERQGYWPLVAHGISMGGHMASLGATVWPKPIALVPCLSWSTASSTFTRGVMSGSIPWDQLEKEYSSTSQYRDEVLQMINSDTSAFRAGIEFAQQYEANMRLEEENERQVKSFANSSETMDKNLSHDTRSGSVKKASGKGILESLQLANLAEYLPATFSFASIRKSSSELESTESMSPKSRSDWLRREAVQFFSGIMDECTHLKNFDVPYDPSLIIIVVAENDAYQPREGVASLPDIWPGAKLRFIPDNGHVAAYLFKQDVFRNAIYDALDLFVEKYGYRQLAGVRNEGS